MSDFLSNLIEQDAAGDKDVHLPESGSVSDVTKLIATFREESHKLALLEQDVKKQKEKIRQLEQDVIPEAFAAMGGISSFDTTDNMRVSVKEDFKVSVAAAGKESAYRFLEESGMGGVIKSKLTLEFGMHERSQLAYAVNVIREGLQLEPTCANTVHPSTLKSTVKELLAQGVDIPPEFSVFEFNKVTIKPIK